MPIEVNVTNQEIEVSTSGQTVNATVGGGVGPAGPAGPPGESGASTWNDISGKPSEFPPEAHTHALADITDVGTAAASDASDFASAVHGHSAGDITGLAASATTDTTDAANITSGTLNASRLPTSGVAAGTYTSVTVDTYGRVTAGSSPSIAYSSLTGLPTLGTAAAANTGDFAAASHAHAWADITSGVPSTFTPSAHNHAASEITSGTLDVSRLPVGTGSTQVAAGDHTHAQLHDRSHAITSSSDHTATAWRVFYSNGSGVVTELAIGASGTVLQSNGASSAPSFAAVSGESFHPFLLAGM